MSTFNATNVTIFTGSYSQTFSLLTDSYDASGSNATVAALQTAFFINALSTIFAQLDPTVNSDGKALWSPLMTALVSTIQSTSVLAGLEPLFLSLLYVLSTTGTSASTITSWVQVWETAAPTAKTTTGTADLVFYDLVKGQLYGISPATLDSFYAGTYLSTPAVLPQLIELSATWTINKPFTTIAPSSKFMHRRALLLAEKQSNSLVDRDGPASQEKTFLDGCLFVAAVIATGLAIATPPGAIAAAIALGVASGLTLVGTGVPLLEDLGVMKPLSDATPPSAQGSPGVALASADTSGQQQGAQLNFAIVPPGSVLEGLGDSGNGGNGGNGDGGDAGNGGSGGDGGGSGSGGDGGDGGGNGDGGDGGNGSGDGGSGDGGDGGSGDGGSGDGGDGGSGGDGGDGGSGDGGDGGSGGSGDGGSGDGGDGGSGGDGGDGGDGGSGGNGDGGDGGDGGSSGNGDGDGGDGGSSGNGNGDGGDGGNGGGNGDGGNGDGGNGDGGDGGSGDGGSGDGGDGGDANAKA